MTASVCLLFCSLVFSANDSKSAALIQSLPVDGAWVSFSVSIGADGNEFSPTWHVRSVGKAEYEGKSCRFIEMEQKLPGQAPIPQLANVTWRMLIPEAEFGEGKTPFANALKVWVQRDNEAARLINSISQEDPLFALLIAGPNAEIKSLKEREKVSWQRGNLECDVVTGQCAGEFLGAKLKMTHRILGHKDVPFGLVGMTQELFFGATDTPNARITVTLQDHGTDAKPKLPDLKP